MPSALAKKLLSAAEMMHRIIRHRDDMFTSRLFINPTWSIYLTLYIAEKDGAVRVAALRSANRLTESEAAAAMEALVDAGLVKITLSATGDEMMALTPLGSEKLTKFLRMTITDAPA